MEHDIARLRELIEQIEAAEFRDDFAYAVCQDMRTVLGRMKTRLNVVKRLRAPATREKRAA